VLVKTTFSERVRILHVRLLYMVSSLQGLIEAVIYVFSTPALLTYINSNAVVYGYSFPTSHRAYLNVRAALCFSEIMAVRCLFI
jgi:hypothetical protein